MKIFFGASAGVGKTYAMLGDAQQQLLKGNDVVIGVIETHGRADTEIMADGIERLPLRDVPYRGHMLKEFDLEAAISRKPAIILMDELAHSNVVGSLHPKRWQDVQELLDAGIDVYTTINVQHLESLNDIVSGITGIRVWETVPDRVFDEADEVIVVDFPPMRCSSVCGRGKSISQNRRIRHRRIFSAREIFLPCANWRCAGRRIASMTKCSIIADAIRPPRCGPHASRCWRASIRASAAKKSYAVAPACREIRCAMACHPRGERERLFERSAAPVDAPRPQASSRPRRNHHDIVRVRGCSSAGALCTRAQSVAPGDGPIASALALALAEDIGEAVEAEASDLDILRVALPDMTKAENDEANGSRQRGEPVRWKGHAAATVVCGVTALLATPLLGLIELTNIVMLFLLAVVVVALVFGRGPAVLAAFVGVGLFDFFFVPPRFSFAVSDIQYLMTFAVMLVVALVIGQLTAGLRVQVAAVSGRERRISALYEMSRELSATLLSEQVAEIGMRFMANEFGMPSALLVADADDRLRIVPGATTEVDMGVAQWSFERGVAAGRGTDTLPASKCLVLPLKATMRLRGVLAVEPGGSGLLDPEQRRALDTCATLMAISIERIHYFEIAQKTMVQMESERLRNSLLSAISHDLRTPLASLVGLADTLQMIQPSPTDQQAELIQSMRHSAMRMNTLVGNLLDMARLESGAVQLNRQWQPFEEVLGSALGACAPLLDGRPIKTDLPADLPLLQFDTVLIERVLVNVLENTAKYTPAGSAIGIHAYAESDNVILRIDDSGPGLPPGREEAIFDKFERGRRESATPGVGLGLAICRAIMQAHGGTIRGETRKEGGASFVITLPRGKPPVDNGADELPDE